MKTAILCYLLSLSPVEQSAIRTSLGQIESGGNDYAEGRFSEVSRYQIKPSVWKEHCGAGLHWAPVEKQAWQVAQKIINSRADSFRKVMGRFPSPAETYGLWSRPRKMYNPKTQSYNLNRLTKRERDRCERFAALVEDSLKPKKK